MGADIVPLPLPGAHGRAHMCRSLLPAGRDTTASLISHALLALLKNQKLWDGLRSPTAGVPAAASASASAAATPEVAGIPTATAVPAAPAAAAPPTSDFVVLAVRSANPDTALHHDAERLGIVRVAGAHLGFGHGPHQRVGQQLARLELTCVLATVPRPRRIPSPRLAVPGPTSLPGTWDL